MHDEFKRVIKVAMTLATSREDFKEMLNRAGFDVEYRTADPSKRTDPRRGASRDFGDYFLIKLVDLEQIPEGEKIPRNLSAKSYKLGTDYSLEALDKAIERNCKDAAFSDGTEFVKKCQAELKAIEDEDVVADEVLDIQIDADKALNAVPKKNNAFEKMLQLRDTEEREWSGIEADDVTYSDALNRTEASRKLAKLLIQESREFYEDEISK